MRGEGVPLSALGAFAYQIPTDAPESDGTFAWDSTTIVVIEVDAGGHTGLGYAYTHRSAADVATQLLWPAIRRGDALATNGCWEAMRRAVRNVGAGGIAASAIAAVDIALWDLKAKLLNVSLVDLLGAVRERVPVYGSGGFTSYSTERLCRQLGGWAEAGIARVKMKVGRDPEADGERVRAARAAIGPDAGLMVDANGALTRKQALTAAADFSESGTSWFEEPVTSDDIEGLRLIRDLAPAGMEIAAGEYGWTTPDFQRLLDAGAVDVLQADATRCQGISGFLAVGALCAARSLPLSAHTAPSLHLHPCCALSALRDVEYFHDHVRIESMLFDGAAVQHEGRIAPDRSRPGLGLELKRADAEPFRV
ncbi:MAG TPA: enolase C-terminal domain-like protein [Gemmatimonadales bacterium]